MPGEGKVHGLMRLQESAVNITVNGTKVTVWLTGI